MTDDALLSKMGISFYNWVGSELGKGFTMKDFQGRGEINQQCLMTPVLVGQPDTEKSPEVKSFALVIILSSTM